MLLDDVHLFIVEIKVSIGILKSSVGMGISVEKSLVAFDMPVIKEIVMEKSSSYKAPLIDLDTEPVFKEVGINEAELGDRYYMLIHAGMTMLDELFHLPSPVIG